MIRRGSRRNSIQPARGRQIVFLREVGRTLIRLPAPQPRIFQRIPHSCSARQPASSVSGQRSSVGVAGRHGIGDGRHAGAGARYDSALDQHRFGSRVLTLVSGRHGTRLGRMVRRPLGGPTDVQWLLAILARRRQQRGAVRVRRRRGQSRGKHQAGLATPAATRVQHAEGTGRRQPAGAGDEVA